LIKFNKEKNKKN